MKSSSSTSNWPISELKRSSKVFLGAKNSISSMLGRLRTFLGPQKWSRYDFSILFLFFCIFVTWRVPTWGNLLSWFHRWWSRASGVQRALRLIQTLDNDRHLCAPPFSIRIVDWALFWWLGTSWLLRCITFYAFLMNLSHNQVFYSGAVWPKSIQNQWI